jgi:membrane-associated phospholipid phosphatase
VELLRREPLISWPLELGAMGAASLIWAGGEYLRVRRAPETQGERTAQHVLNRIDRLARQLLFRRAARTEIADRAADTLAYVAVPLACGLVVFAIDRRGRQLIADVLRIARAVTVTGALNQAVKFLAPRERPFVLDNPEAQGNDRYGSFFSNHTSAVTAMASATTHIAMARGASAWFGIPLFGFALFVGYLRIAADRHFLTDVLAGAAFGAAAGLVFTR